MITKKIQKMIVPILIVAIYLFVNCKESSDHSSHDHSNHGNSHLIPASDAASGSLFSIESQWKSESGKTIALKDFKGKLVVISMFYATCQSVCPRIVSDVKQVSNQIHEKTGEIPQIVLVTFDPENDTADVLQKYKKKYEMGENWTILRGTDDDVRMLSVSLGVNYKKTSTGDFNHSAIISLLSKEGVVVSRVEGVGSSSEKLVTRYKDLR
ncbi:MAG: SCO family protein [Leptospira sp.]|nr:SCO family protein [Leptospira sp.]